MKTNKALEATRVAGRCGPREGAIDPRALTSKSFVPLLMPLPGEIAEEKRRAKGRKKQAGLGQISGAGLLILPGGQAGHTAAHRGQHGANTLGAQKGSGSAASWDSPAFASASRFAESGGGLRI